VIVSHAAAPAAAPDARSDRGPAGSAAAANSAAASAASDVEPAVLSLNETIAIEASALNRPVDAGGAQAAPFGRGAYRLGNDIQPPRVLKIGRAQYTAEAMRHRVQGSVLVEAVVQPDGHVGDVRLIKSLDPQYGLDAEALSAARTWTFEPGRDRNGQAVPVIVGLQIDFHLRRTRPSTGPTAPAGAAVTTPVRTRYVKPLYPLAARAAHVQGTVVVLATIDESGAISHSEIWQSVPMLDQAALEAVRQWRYQPARVNGVPTSIPATITAEFSLRDLAPAPVRAGSQASPGIQMPPPSPPPPMPSAENPVEPAPLAANIQPPTKIHDVRPAYPPDALAANVGGAVILAAAIDADGNVADARVLRSVPMLDAAAVDAVLQWKYNPALADGTPTPVTITVTVNFVPRSTTTRPDQSGAVNPASSAAQVDSALQSASASLRAQTQTPGAQPSGSAPSAWAPADAVRIGGDIREPLKIRDVKPMYPQEARDANVQGVVILEAVIDTAGNVSNARVLRSVPLLDDAALNAVQQWKYTPTLVNGVPAPVVMTVTVNFTLP
jgi:TonB family protein